MELHGIGRTIPGKDNYCNGLFVSYIDVRIMAKVVRIMLNFVRPCGRIIFTRFTAVRPYNVSLKATPNRMNSLKPDRLQTLSKPKVSEIWLNVVAAWK